MRAIVGTLLGASVLGSVVSAEAPPASFALVNGDFSAGLKGWEQAASAKAHGFFIRPGPGRHGAGVTLRSPVTSAATDGGNITQEIDAKPFRGKVVSLTGWIRTRTSAFVGLALRVDASSQRPTFGADTHGQPVPADGQWHRLMLTARISRDAETIVVALTGRGAVDADYDNIDLSIGATHTAPPSAEAAAYLDRAIAFIGKTHIKAIGNPDWPRLVAQARGDAAGAKTPADTHFAIEGLLAELHEHHAMLVTKDQQRRRSAVAADDRPTVELQDGRYGVVTLTSIEIDDADHLARRYLDTVRAGLVRIDAVPICGWVVDLRSDHGGTTQVMAGAVAGLADPVNAWPDDPSDWESDLRWIFTLPAQPLRQGSRPVAMLLGPATASAGEDTALRFIGRRGPLRSFGTATAGYTSANATLMLSDGAMLAVPSGYMHDRAGRLYKEALVPDEVTADPLTAAKHWLAEQCR